MASEITRCSTVDYFFLLSVRNGAIYRLRIYNAFLKAILGRVSGRKEHPRAREFVGSVWCL